MYGYTNQLPTRRPGGYGYRNAGAYPSGSNAWSGAAWSLWWQSTFGNVSHLCATQIATLMRACQTVLSAAVPAVFTVDSLPFSSLDVTIDGEFGPHSFAALRWYMSTQATGIPSNVMDALRSDWQRLCPAGDTLASARGLQVGRDTMQAIIWVAAHRQNPWNTVTLPSTMASTVHFAMPAPDDGANSGRVRCSPLGEGASGLAGSNALDVPAGASTPNAVPGWLGPLPGSSGASTPEGAATGGSEGGMLVALFVVLGLAVAGAGKRKRLF